MLLASNSIIIGEKWTTVLTSGIDVDFFLIGAVLGPLRSGTFSVQGILSN